MTRRKRDDPATYTFDEADQNQPGEGERVDISASCGAPFPIYSKVEKERYQWLRQRDCHYFHAFDWKLITELNLKDRILEYLSFLGLSTFATTEWVGYNILTLELLVTMELEEGGKVLSCRLLGEDCRVTQHIMHAIFGFGLAHTVDKDKSYDPTPHWKELTGGVGAWKPKGTPNGFIQDTALALCHKFISFNIFAKEQANKVNSTEVFMLHCALKKKKFCPTHIIWKQLNQMRTRSTATLGLFPIATGIAIYFDLINPGECPRRSKEVDTKLIDYFELRGSKFISDDRKVLAYHDRKCVREFYMAQAAAQAAPSTANLNAASTSRASPEAMETETPAAGASPPITRADLFSLQAHFDSTFGDFRRDIFKRMDEQDQRLDRHERHLSSLDESWRTWTTAAPGPPPPTNHE